MKLKKILLSTTLAITSVLAGFTIATSSAQADTTSDADTTQTEQVAPQVSTTDATSDVTTDAATSDTATDVAVTDDSATTQVQASTDTTADAQTATTPVATAASTTTTTDSTQDKILTTVKNAAKDKAADIVGNDIVAPVTGSVLSKVKPLSNVYAGATGFVDPTSNVLGKVSHDIQDAAIDVVGNLPGGKIPSLLMKLAQPFDLTDNNIGGLYGLATGENDLIPNAVGNKVTEAIKGTKETTKTTAKTDYSDGYKNNRINNTVTTTTQAPLFNVMEQPVSRSLQAGTNWFTDIQRVNTKTGATYYRVSTNEYVRASDVQLG